MLDVPAHLMLSTVPADRLQVFRLMVDSDSRSDLSRLSSPSSEGSRRGGEEWHENGTGRASHADGDLSSSMPLGHVSESLSALAQRVRPVDDGCDLSGFDELLEMEQVLGVLLRNERAQPLTDEPRDHPRFGDAAQWPEPLLGM